MLSCLPVLPRALGSIGRGAPVPLPIAIAVALPVGVGSHADGLRGALWGLLPAACSGLFPHLLNRWFKRRQARRSEPGGVKPLPQLILTALSQIIGQGVLMLASAAPRSVLAVTVSLFAILVAIGIAHRWPRFHGRRGWNVSVHVASSAAACTVCWQEWGMWAGLLIAVLTLLVAYSRLWVYARTQGHEGHTMPQAVAGGLLGAAVCGVIFACLR